MKKAISIVVGVVLLLSMLTACGEKEFECSMCGETFEGKAHKATYNGVKASLCDDCYELYELSQELGSLFD